MPNRKPALTSDEQGYIKQFYKSKTVYKIAEELDRDYRSIKKFIQKNLVSDLISPPVITKSELMQYADSNLVEEIQASPEWTQLCLEFLPDELKTFAYSYAQYMTQFNRDVLATERTQIMMCIKLELLIHRNLRERRTNQKLIEATDKEIEELRVKIKIKTSDDPQEDKHMILALQDKISALFISQKSMSMEYTNLLEKHGKMLSDLKATREQRVKVIENRKMSFLDLLKSLQLDEFRAKEGKYLELVKMAGDKSYQKLGQLHKYADGQYDRPILCAKTLEGDNIEKEN